jgi:hypothetical protein
LYSLDPPLRDPSIKRTGLAKVARRAKRKAGALFYYVNDPNLVNLELRERPSPPSPDLLMVGRDCIRIIIVILIPNSKFHVHVIHARTPPQAA